MNICISKTWGLCCEDQIVLFLVNLKKKIDKRVSNTEKKKKKRKKGISGKVQKVWVLSSRIFLERV